MVMQKPLPRFYGNIHTSSKVFRQHPLALLGAGADYAFSLFRCLPQQLAVRLLGQTGKVRILCQVKGCTPNNLKFC